MKRLIKYNLIFQLRMKLLTIFILVCLCVCSLANLNLDFNSHLRELVHNSKINHRFRVSHLVAKYTPQQTKFMANFGNQLLGFLFSDEEILTTIFSGQNLTDAQTQRFSQFLLNNKDFPRFIALGMRNQSQTAWVGKLPGAQQIRVSNIVIDQMKGSKTLELTSDGIRKIMLKVLNDKDLSTVYVNNQIDIDLKKLTTQTELTKLQKQFPVLSKISAKKVTAADKILIMKTLISDDEYWNKNMAQRINKLINKTKSSISK